MIDECSDGVARRFRAARPLHADVDRWACHSPERLAVAWEGEDDGGLTYSRLSAWSNQVGALLAARGLGVGDRVVLALGNGPEAVAAMLGVSKAGGVCVPLNHDLSSTRSRQVIEAVKARLVVTGSDRLGWAIDELPANGSIGVGTLGMPQSIDERAAFTGLDIGFSDPNWSGPSVGADDLAQILFKWSPTGVRRGVMVTHRALVSVTDWATSDLGYDPTDQLSGHAPPHVDLSSLDIYGALAAGATLHPVAPAIANHPGDLARFIRGSRLTQWLSEPAALELMVRSGVIEHLDFPHLRRLVWRGADLSPSTLGQLIRLLPHVELTRLYGRTETTIASSWCRVPDWPADPNGPVPIGIPCTGERLMIVGTDGRPMPDGEIGELYVGGVGLSPGYWRDPELTEAAFWREQGTGERFHPTGDLAYRHSDGSYFVLGPGPAPVAVDPHADPGRARSARSAS